MGVSGRGLPSGLGPSGCSPCGRPGPRPERADGGRPADVPITKSGVWPGPCPRGVRGKMTVLNGLHARARSQHLVFIFNRDFFCSVYICFV